MTAPGDAMRGSWDEGIEPLRTEAAKGSAALPLSAATTFLALSALLMLMLVPVASAGPGDPAWLRVYDGATHNSDVFTSTAPAPGGGVYVAGTSSNVPSNVDYNVLVARYTSAGQRRWLRTYDGPGGRSFVTNSSAADRQGNLVVVGGADNATMFVIKYGTGGQRRWVRIYDDPGSLKEAATSVATDAAGNIYVAGSTSPTASTLKIAVVKYSSAGKRLWVRHYSPAGRSATPADVAVDGAGKVYVTGRSSNSATDGDIVTLKYDGNGRRSWARLWDGPGGGDDSANALAVTRTGTVFVAGTATGVSSGYDAVVLKYAPTGALKWSRRRAGPSTYADGYQDVAVLSNGDVAVAGFIGGSPSVDALVVRLSSSGRTRWARSWDGGQNDLTYDIAQGPSGAIYAAGSTYSPTTIYDIVTLKYSGAGRFGWARIYAATGGHDQQSESSLTVNGRVYVAGFQQGAVSSDAVLLNYKP